MSSDNSESESEIVSKTYTTIDEVLEDLPRLRALARHGVVHAVMVIGGGND